MEWLFPDKEKDMKKIIEAPMLNRAELICSFCGCKFSFDISDVDYLKIQEETDMFGTTHNYSGSVYCPICHKENKLHSDTISKMIYKEE